MDIQPYDRIVDWGPLRCSHVLANGTRCAAKRYNGIDPHNTLCIEHGGIVATPAEYEQALITTRRREAQLQLTSHMLDAVNVLIECLGSSRELVRLKAAAEFLDRGGLGKAPSAVVGVNNVNVVADRASAEEQREEALRDLFDRIERLGGDARVVDADS